MLNNITNDEEILKSCDHNIVYAKAQNFIKNKSILFDQLFETNKISFASLNERYWQFFNVH